MNHLLRLLNRQWLFEFKEICLRRLVNVLRVSILVWYLILWQDFHQALLKMLLPCILLFFEKVMRLYRISDSNSIHFGTDR